MALKHFVFIFFVLSTWVIKSIEKPEVVVDQSTAVETINYVSDRLGVSETNKDQVLSLVEKMQNKFKPDDDVETNTAKPDSDIAILENTFPLDKSDSVIDILNEH